MHEVDVFGKRLAQRLGHGLHAPIGHEASPDLSLNLPGTCHRLKSALKSISASCSGVTAYRSTWFHSGETHNRLSSQGPQHGVVATHERLEKHLGQLFRSKRRHAAASSAARLPVAGHLRLLLSTLDRITVRNLVLGSP